ncbi:MAG: hypothetical protein AAB875_07690 [Patescibacteria group bacterium]
MAAWDIRQQPLTPNQVVTLVDQNLDQRQNDQDNLALLVQVGQAELLQKLERQYLPK